MIGALASSLFAGGCETNPATGRTSFTAFMSPESEIEVGREQHPQIVKEFGGEVNDPKLQAYVTEIGQRLAKQSELPDLQWTFTVLDSEITNAFALPGGYVYVTRGLLALASSEAELAGVLGHEIGHVTARHSAQRYSASVLASGLSTIGSIAISVLTGSSAAGNLAGQAGQGVAGIALAGYSRDQEFEADTLGVRYLARGGYDPSAMSDFLAKLQAESALTAELAGRPGAADDHNIMATHPRTQDRVHEAIAAAQKETGAPITPDVGRETYLAAIKGMSYSGDRENGFVRNRTFIHPSLRFQFEAPPGFMVVNSSRNVTARGPDGASLVFDSQQETRNVPMTEYLTGTWARGAKLSAVERIEVNGLEAASGTTRLSTKQGPMDLRLVAIRFDPKTIYRFMFASPPAATSRFNEPFRRTAQSFRKLSEAEAKAAQPPRIQVVTVGPRDTVESLARRMAFDTAQEARFRVLNGLAPDERIQPGQQVKIVE